MTALGLLIEPAATNLIVQSQDLTQAAWTKLGCSVGTAIIAPDTSTTAVPITVTASPFPTVHEAFTVASGTAYSFSGYVRYISGDSFLNFEMNDAAAGQATTYINIVNGNVAQVNANHWTLNSNSLNQILNGWFNIRNSFTPGFSSTATNFNFYQSAVTLAAGVTAGASSTIGSKLAVWGLQLETGTMATSYFPTTTGSAARSADVVVLTLANATYDILVEDTAGAEFRSGTIVGTGTYTLLPRTGQLHVTRVRVWPSSGAGSLTAAQKAAIAPG